MQFITELLSVLNTEFSAANLRNFGCISESILGLSRSVTTLSVARFSSLSYRTVQRFYALKDINWLIVRFLLFKLVYQKEKHYLLAADETVEDKAGKSTHGLGRFYSSLAGRVIRSVSFLALTIIDIQAKTSYVLGLSQLPANVNPKVDESKKTTPVKQPKGRPKGSKNKPKQESQSASYQLLKTLLTLVCSNLKSLLPDLQCFHLVLDGFYGHEDYLLLALENKLNIVSKFKANAHLILPYEGPQAPKGRRKTNGEKVNLNQLDEQYYRSTLADKDSNVSTKVYQFKAKTPKIAHHWLNVVVLVHTHQLTRRQSRTILFTNDLTLDGPTIINFYSLRFQIEFDFRDAKQYFGLSDFKNYRQTQVINAVNLAFTMTLVSKLLVKNYKYVFNSPSMGILDLKAIFRIRKYVKTLLNSEDFNADEFLNSPQFLNVARLEAIHI